MHLFGPIHLGIAIVVLLAALVVVKQLATGSILVKLQGCSLLQLVNVFNLYFLLLVVNPLAAIGLILGRLESLDPTHLDVGPAWLLSALEAAGALLYVAGFALMAWALLTLRRNYQLGGSPPRSEDRLIVDGPYALIRHPMYAAALAISLGLACLLQSLAFSAVFVIYLALILPLIALEEKGLRQAYGEKYAAYQKATKRIMPAVY